MMQMDALVRSRRSVRTFDERKITSEDRQKLCAFMESIENPYSLPIEYRLLENMASPVITGTNLYVGGKMKVSPHLNEAFGYSFETLVLYAESLGIGTTWIGGTMDRAAFEKAMALGENEVMPCVSPLGYPAEKMSLREKMMRKGVRADVRMPFEEIFFDGGFDRPLTKDAAGLLYFPLEMVRLAPSAVNRQPWRIVIKDGAAHFYLKRSKGFGGGTIDMQKIDMGIALCHFDLSAQEAGMATEFMTDRPDIENADGLAYIASYKIR